MVAIEAAVSAIGTGGLIVYPTETVYGLGADALDEAAVRRVFEVKGRDRSDPISLAVPDLTAAEDYVRLTDRERRFMDRFLPGPVTVVCDRRDPVPDVLTAGKDRVGVRIPDHDLALEVLSETSPITATSANLSGESSASTVEDLDEQVLSAVDVILEGGETGGTVSTVVDVENEQIHRRGALANDVDEWLEPG